MAITKYYLSGGFTFEATFDRLDNGKIKITHIYDNRDDAEEVAYTTEAEIAEIVGDEWYHGIEELTDCQVKNIIRRLDFNK